MPSPATARRLWALGEPFHALTYFADEARTAFGAVGLRTFWTGYFDGPAARLAGVDPAVQRALPGCTASAEAGEVAGVAQRAAAAVDLPGRPLAAANAA